MIVSIRRMGEPCLLEKSVAVTSSEFNSIELLNLIDNLSDTQHHFGGVGIAAPQIGINKRIFIIEYYQKDITRYSNTGDCPRKIIINPEILSVSNEQISFNEGCLSLPGLRGTVNRSVKISYQYFDQFGNLYRGEDDGFFARVFQHEYDHLDGMLYPMRMNDLRSLSYVDADK